MSEKKSPVFILEDCGCFRYGNERHYCMLHSRDFRGKWYKEQKAKLDAIMDETRKMHEHIVFNTPKGMMICPKK